MAGDVANKIVFPAPAGINRSIAGGRDGRLRVPRASGDKPVIRAYDAMVTTCSPRQRG
ncbi:hypothetical protein H7532_002240 [Salmonella enterica subsp. enterica serovar Infantis]|nr:hypothetical protein [Salmonella enterica subsp. enterica serovar Infantis]EGC9287430.1 hypothetical protein [Salmonella enterica subsp. enterica serovar Infantis]